MIDLHTHLLPGIDDGAPDLEASLAMARAALAGGVEAAVATPHVSSTYRNDPLALRARVDELQAAFAANDLPLRLHAGAEVSYSMLHSLSDDAVRACCLGDGDWLLLELPLSGPAPFVDRLVGDLQLRRYQVLLAHPERIAAFQRDIGLVERLVEQGCLCSITAGSLSGQFGGSVKRFTGELLARGLVHNIASDAHDAEHRSPALRTMLAPALAELPELESWLGYLTEDVPAAILAGKTPQALPPVIEPPRGLLGRLLRR